MKRYFDLWRDVIEENITFGELYNPKDEHFCFTLEDAIRPYGIKVYGETCIPETGFDFSYYLRIRNSPKYGKVVAIFTDFDGNDTYTLNNGGISFTQILGHGGNKTYDTKGCPLVNKNRDSKANNAWGSMKDEFVEEVEKYLNKGFDTRLRVHNKGRYE